MKFLRKYFGQLLFLLIGILAGFFISRLPLKFEDKVSWIQLASFFLTIILALYLEFVVRPSFSNNRSEKDFIIEQLKEIKTDVGEIQQKYETLKKETPVTIEGKAELISKFRQLSNKIGFLKKLDTYCSITKNELISDEIFKAYIKYKKSLTGQKFNNKDFIFDRFYWKDQDKFYQEFINCIMCSIIDVNKL